MPFVGAGVNHTLFFSEGSTGALADSDLELGPSWGLAARASALVVGKKTARCGSTRAGST